VRIAKSSISARTRNTAELKFEDQNLTSYGGLVVFQKLFEVLDLPRQLRNCCRSLEGKGNRFYSHAKLLQILIVHLLVGSRKLREMDYYREDPVVCEVVGLKQLPSVPTVSRMLREFDEESVSSQRELNRRLILSRLSAEKLKTLTLDFDGSVQSTTRHAEGTAVGFNKKKKGARSYYPLFCTLAQSGQVFDFLHRSGNVHDSNGALGFVKSCVAEFRASMPGARIELRLDSAFFSDEMISGLEELKVEYSISVPFERFVELKEKIEKRNHWWPAWGSEGRSSYFEERWKPMSWSHGARFVFVRSKVKTQSKGPLQLDLFEPVEEGFEHKVIVTNKTCLAGSVVRYHEGRGYQEKIFAELKSQAQMDYIPARHRVANQVYLLCSMMAHNLGRELQMQVNPPARGVTLGRTVHWVFEELSTLRRNIIQRAGRLTRPQGKLTLTLGVNRSVQDAILRFMAL
jgi:hypothetical protein